jgi:tetratricopeptide (TPR) repeat protein
MIDGEVKPFASPEELVISGLLVDAMGLAGATRYFEAEGRLRRALYLSPGNDKIRFNLALVLDQIGQSEEAVDILQELATRYPDRPEYRIGLGGALLSVGEKESSLRRFKEAFTIFKDNDNPARAAPLARSISNLAFGFGLEQEALCYSFEAMTLQPTDEQLGRHALLLVGFNLNDTVLKLVADSAVVDPALVRRALVQYAVALAHSSKGDFDKALDAITLGKDYLAKDPLLGAEFNTLEWLLRTRTGAIGETEKAQETHEEFRQEVLDFRTISSPNLIFWPDVLRLELDAVAEVES